jgi:capsular polysaccharide biosynthesis protein
VDKNSSAPNQEIEIDLVRLLFACLGKWWVFLICGVLATAVAIVYSMLFLTPMYQSSISLYVNNRMDRASSDYVSTSDMSASRSLVTTCITISRSDRVLSAVSRAMDNQFSSSYLKSVVSAKQQGQTELFTVTVTTVNPERSAMIANTIADVFPGVLSEIVEGSSAKVIDYAKVPTHRSSPDNTKNALIGLLIGIVLAGVIVFIDFLTDVRVMDEEDLAAVCGYPVLGQIPDFSQISGKHGSKNSGYGYGYGYGYGPEETRAIEENAHASFKTDHSSQ